MKLFAILLSALFICVSVKADTGIDNSILKEAKVSIDKGVKFLLSKQNDNGSWGPYGGMPAMTAIVVNSLLTSPEAESSAVKAAVKKAEASLLKYVQADGSIWAKSAEKGYPNYSTSLSVVSFYLIDRDKHLKTIKKARAFIKGSQFGPETGVEAGGIGYGSTKNKSDLSNTQLALEALYITQDVENESTDAAEVKATKETWAKAMKFMARTQALPSHNDLAWAKAAPGEDIGGFAYSPDRTKVEGEGDMRVYGSMTYAGLKSMVYAGHLGDDKLTKEDPRIKAAFDWAAKNFNLDENPGVGLQGHFYYIQTMAKALDAYDTNKIGKHQWRREVVKKLLSMQKADGHWVNENGRWMENVPEMVTAFSISSLSHALSKDVK